MLFKVSLSLSFPLLFHNLTLTLMHPRQHLLASPTITAINSTRPTRLPLITAPPPIGTIIVGIAHTYTRSANRIHHSIHHRTPITDANTTIAKVAISAPRTVKATLAKANKLDTHSHSIPTVPHRIGRTGTTGNENIIRIIIGKAIPTIAPIQRTLSTTIPPSTRTPVIGTISIIMSRPRSCYRRRPTYGNKGSTPKVIQIVRFAVQSTIAGIPSKVVITNIGALGEFDDAGGGLDELDAGTVTGAGSVGADVLVGLFAGEAVFALVGV